jgi:adenylate cyclase
VDRLKDSSSSRPDTVTERLVTVLFADVRGFTPMTARTAPSDMAERMATFYRWARQEVERHHGLVDEFRGDSVMATFNISTPRLDHTRQAIEAAVALRDKAALMDLPLGAGVAVGPAVVGGMTQDRRVTVLGEVANLAARLQSAAGPGEVLMDPEAFRRVAGWLEDSGQEAELRRLDLKGISDPVNTSVLRAATSRGGKST